MTKLAIVDLRTATNLLLDHLEATAGGEIEIEDDFYWEVPSESRYDRYSEPREHTLGQLSEDIEHIVKVARETEDPINYGLVWLACILPDSPHTLPP